AYISNAFDKCYLILLGTTSNEENIGSVRSLFMPIQFAGTKVCVSALTGHDNIVFSFYLDVSVL
ncbi:hypothetical protein ACJX0J_038938, partial [Zea mays]